MKKPTITEYLIGNEELLAQLYKMHSQKYSSHADFWGRLSDDEKSHAKKIMQLTETAKIKFDNKRFNEKELESFKNQIEEEIDRFSNKDLTIQDALRSAVKLEKSLSESKFFTVFENDTEELKEELLDISESVEKHKERIQKMMEKL